MVVIVLMGVLSAMILPEMRGTYSGALLRATSRDLVSLCGVAASRAVSLQQAHRVRLDPATRRFALEQRARGAGRDSGFTPVTGVPGTQGKIDPRVSVGLRNPGSASGETIETDDDSRPAPTSSADSGRDADGIRFYPDGTADSVEIQLRDQDRFGLALRVNPTTARVRIVELPRE